MSSTSTSQSPPKQALRDMDPNTTSPTKKPTEEIKSMDFHRQVLQDRLSAENSEATKYVSPSDTIMSPCTAKLSQYKGKKFARAKGQNLFAKATAPKTSTGVEGEGEKVEGR